MKINKTREQLLSVIGIDADVQSAKGCYLTLVDGRHILDVNSQYGSVSFGHNPSFVSDAIKEYLQASNPMMVQPYKNKASEKLSEILADITNNDFDHVNFSSTGAESVEVAIKQIRCKSNRNKLLAAHKGFHGKTMGALSVTVDRLYTEPFLSSDQLADTVVFGCIADLEEKLSTRNYAALFLEPIQGEGGINTTTSEYFNKARELCSRYGTFLVFDEIQTGFLRTGACFSYQKYQIVPDLLLIGKALGGGVLPITACLSSNNVWTEEFCKKHSSTFSNNGLCAAAATSVVSYVSKNMDELTTHVCTVSRQFMEGAKGIQQRYPEIISDVRGEGLLIGVQFVEFSGSYFFKYLARSGMQIPLICSYLFNVHSIHCAPTLKKNSVLRIEPPLTINKYEIDMILQGIEGVCELVSEQGPGGLIEFLLSHEDVSNAA